MACGCCLPSQRRETEEEPSAWADGAEFVRVDAAALAAVPRGALRGFMFWVIDEEGVVPDHTEGQEGGVPLFFARELRAALEHHGDGGDDSGESEL